MVVQTTEVGVLFLVAFQEVFLSRLDALVSFKVRFNEVLQAQALVVEVVDEHGHDVDRREVSAFANAVKAGKPFLLRTSLTRFVLTGFDADETRIRGVCKDSRKRPWMRKALFWILSCDRSHAFGISNLRSIFLHHARPLRLIPLNLRHVIVIRLRLSLEILPRNKLKDLFSDTLQAQQVQREKVRIWVHSRGAAERVVLFSDPVAGIEGANAQAVELPGRDGEPVYALFLGVNSGEDDVFGWDVAVYVVEGAATDADVDVAG